MIDCTYKFFFLIGKRKTKKRADKFSWNNNERKRLRQSGMQYQNIKGDLVPAKNIVYTKDCTKCQFKSARVLDNYKAKLINDNMYSIKSITLDLINLKKTCMIHV